MKFSKFFLVLAVLAFCFHVPDLLASRSEYAMDSLAFISNGFDATRDLEPLDTVVQPDKATEIANLITMISRVLIAVTGAIFGVKTLISKK